MKPSDSISWPTDPVQAIRVQKELAGKVQILPLPRPARTVAAIDLGQIGPPRQPTHQVAGVIVYDIEARETVERHAIIRPIRFPYIPGLLSFREAPAALDVIEKIHGTVDVFLIDGQGLAHPRRIGIATHIGILIDRPTVGCAKSRLTGRPEKPLPASRGSWVHLIDKGEVVGGLVRTRTNVEPLYVSVGHRITLDESVELVLTLAPRFRLPEPARLAHNYVTCVARGELDAEPNGPEAC